MTHVCALGSLAHCLMSGFFCLLGCVCCVLGTCICIVLTCDMFDLTDLGFMVPQTDVFPSTLFPMFPLFCCVLRVLIIDLNE